VEDLKYKLERALEELAVRIRVLLKGLPPQEQEPCMVDISPEDFNKLNAAIKRENANLWAEIERLEQENEKLKKILESMRSAYDEEIEEALQEQERYLKELMEKNRYRIYFRTKKPIIVVSAIGGEPFKSEDGMVTFPYLRGIEFEKSPYGTLVNLILADKIKKPGIFTREKPIVGRLRVGHIDTFTQMIFNPDNLVEDLRKGVIMLNITPDGSNLPSSFKIPVEVDVYGGEEEGISEDSGNRPERVGDDRKERDSSADSSAVRANKNTKSKARRSSKVRKRSHSRKDGVRDEDEAASSDGGSLDFLE